MSQPSEPNISSRTVVGAAWLIGARFATKALDLVTLLVLARILRPTDFGVVAVAMSVVAVVEAVFELSVSQALVQIPKLVDRHFDTAFTLGVARGAVVGAVLLGISLPLSWLYGDPHLPVLILALSTAPIARGLTSPRMFNFFREMNFWRDFVVELLAKGAGAAAAMSLAFAFHNYWALVAGTVATPLIMVAVSYAFAPYLPKLSLHGWEHFSGYLGWTSLTQLVTAVNWQIDRMLLGRLVPMQVLGAYSMANDISSLPDQTLVKNIIRPVLAAFARLDGDKARLCAAYKKTSAAIVTIGLPVMLVLAAEAHPLVRMVLGKHWTSAAAFMSGLSVVCIPYLFTSPLSALSIILRRTKTFFLRNLFELAVKVPAVIVGGLLFSAWGVVAARAVGEVILLLVSMVFAKELIGLRIRDQVACAWRPLCAAAPMLLVLKSFDAAAARYEGPLLIGFEGVLIAASVMAYSACLAGLWWSAGRPAGIEQFVMDRLGLVTRGRRRVIGQGFLHMRNRV